ncbi:uncharacterized protein LOC110831838 [Zootermopsis nevadensis]|uniref:Protein TsetseEP domain-containing protein n=1 Tax=Zootermopsis nevadensis TaxID=136037 RepID=A0A067R2Z4_ZOONE|nr:uncharacterized protein LOC110831838 [Zootermopsis nevadensis]KDR17284.1 hypothetical protein L798_08850 [Zootermopsis nevadensis]
MNAKFIIVALCAVQLAAGSILSDAADKLKSQVTPIVDQATQVASSLTQQAQTYAQDVLANASSQFQPALSSSQQNLTALLSSAQEAEPKIQACLETQSEEYASIFNSTKDQLQAEIQSQTAPIKSAIDNISGIASKASGLASNFSTCAGSGITSIIKVPGCLATSLTDATNLASQLYSAINTTPQVPDQNNASNPTAATLQSAADQYQAANTEAENCIQDALTSSNTTDDSSDAAGTA